MNNLTTSVIKISEIIKKDVDIADDAGIVISSSNEARVGILLNTTDAHLLSLNRKQKLYIHIEDGSIEEMGLARLILEDKVSDEKEDNYIYLFTNIMEGYEESKEQLKRFGIPYEGNYVVYCITLPESEHFNDAYSLISNSFYEENNKWVLPYKKDIIVIEQSENFGEDEKSNSRMMEDMINSELYAHVYVGIGNIHSGVRNIKKSYDEAKEAIRIGRMFNLPDNIYVYKDTLAERIISLIPEDRIDKLASGVFNGDFDSIMDDEMVKTVNIMFKNNLNISDSARILYIHRNTLLYRLDKIQKATGLDIRKFEDGVIFKLIFLLKSRRKS